MISFFRDYFNAGDLLTENLILYSLRNITLGSISFFGMAIVQVLTMQKDIVVLEEKVKNFESSFQNIKKEAQLELRETKIKIEKLMNDAELRAKSVIQRKERIEEELKEFIQAEKELLKKYENL